MTRWSFGGRNDPNPFSGGSSGGDSGDDDRVLSPTSPDEPVDSAGGGTTDDPRDDRGFDESNPDRPHDRDDDDDDDRVLTPTSPESPVGGAGLAPEPDDGLGGGESQDTGSTSPSAGAPAPTADLEPDTVSGQGVEQEQGGDEMFTTTFSDGTEFTGSRPEVATQLESRFIEDNPEFDREDVAVTETDDGFGITFTDESLTTFRQAEREAGFRVRDELRAQLEEQTGVDVRDSDFMVRTTDDGFTAQPTDAFIERVGEERREAAEEAFAGSTAQDLLDQERAVEQQLEAQLRSQTGRDIDLEDGDYVVNDDGSVTLTNTGRRKAQGGTGFAERSEAVDVGFLSFVPGLDEDATLLDVEQGAQQTAARASETIDRTVEDGGALADLDAGLLGFYASSQGPLEEADRDVLFTNAEEGDLEDVEVDEDSPAVEQAESALRGGLLLGTTPAGLTSTAVRGYEVAAEAGSRIGTEEFTTTAPAGAPGGPRETESTRVTGLGEAAGVVFEQGEMAGGALVDETVETVQSPTGRAELAGGLVTSALLFGGAAAIGPRASAAARYTIQPGEELGGLALNRGARAAGTAVGRPRGGERVAETLAPDNELLIFSEEAAIAGARGLAQRAETAGSNVRRLSRGEFALGDVPSVTVERFERFRPGGPTSVAGQETTQAAGPSEPLGSFTDFVPSRFETAVEPTETSAEFGGRGITPEMERIARRTRDQELFAEMADELGVPTRLMTGGGDTIAGPRLGARDVAAMAPDMRRPTPESDLPSDPPTELGDVESTDTDLFGRGEAEEGDPGALTAEEQRRLERARMRSFEAEEESVGRETVPRLEPTELDLSVTPELGFRPLLDTRVDADVRAGADTETRPRQDFGLDTELDTETELEQEAETETETELETEQELEQELELEFETETETELEFFNDRDADTRRRTDDRRRRMGGEQGEAGSDLAVGFLGETLAGFAGFGIAGSERRDVTRAELEETQGQFAFGENVGGDTEFGSAVATGLEGLFGEGSAREFGFNGDESNDDMEDFFL